MSKFQPSVSVLKEGYSYTTEEGEQKADCTITLIQTDSSIILVDTGGPWDKEYLITSLEQHSISCDAVRFVIGTHGHSDHIGNLNLFEKATILVSYDLSKRDTYLENNLSEGETLNICEGVSVLATPGHTGSDVSVVVKGTSQGVVVVTGDLFEREEDLDDSSIWEQNSENCEIQRKNREKILQIADYIVPGHGPMFKVPERFRADYDIESDENGGNRESPSVSVQSKLPEWCRNDKYQRYWNQYEQVKQWFDNYSMKQHDAQAQHVVRKDPLYQQYAMSQAWSSSYWVYYHYHNMVRWHQRWQEMVHNSHQTADSLYQRRCEADRHAMPPPRSTIVPHSRQQSRSQCSHRSTSSEGLVQRKRSKHHLNSHRADRQMKKDHVTDIVLDLDPSMLKQEEEVIECHMEITDEMLEFFAQSARHRQERDAQKLEGDKGDKDEYIDISKANSGAARATTEAPTERPGFKRTQEMKMLYGKGAAMIHGMETAMQLTFDRYVDLHQPKLWPHLPLNIKFN